VRAGQFIMMGFGSFLTRARVIDAAALVKDNIGGRASARAAKFVMFIVGAGHNLFMRRQPHTLPPQTHTQISYDVTLSGSF